jgi:hypothetical protein
MRLPFVGTLDERFFEHRLRSTSIGGLAAVVVAAAMFFFQLLSTHVIRWDLFAIVATAAVVKMTVLVWYRVND